MSFKYIIYYFLSALDSKENPATERLVTSRNRDCSTQSQQPKVFQLAKLNEIANPQPKQ